MAEDLCSQFRTFDFRETTEHTKLKADLESLPPVADLMDTGEERIDRTSGLRFLYMECTVMEHCLDQQRLVSNMKNGGISITNLPPYQSDVTSSEVSNVLGSLGKGIIISYGDPYRNSYFVTFVPNNRFECVGKIILPTVNGGSVKYYVYNRVPQLEQDFPYFFLAKL